MQLSRYNIPYPSVFVETGAYRGDGIATYIQCVPFKTIHSIELAPQWVNHCRTRFIEFPNVHIHEGDSATILPTLPLPNEPVLFYLDAHYSGGSTAGESVDNGCPVLRELKYIADRNVVGDVIFVDDMRLMGKDAYSGIEGSKMYPVTRFDFTHVTEDAIHTVFANRSIKYWEMCSGIDRLMIVLE